MAVTTQPAADVSVFRIGTRIVSGVGSTSTVGTELARLGSRRVAVVADQGIEATGLLAQILSAAGEVPVGVTVLIDPNPDVTVAEAAAAAAAGAGCDSVLAVGGGSALCAAKAVAIRLTNPQPITAYEGADRVPIPPAPTVAVPTTAGSGSEVSNALVLHEPGRDREIVVRGVGLEPAVAVLDGSVLRRLPRTPMLYAALDALTHGLEALWTRGRSTFSDALAVGAADAILAWLPSALDGRDDAVLQRLLDASCGANLACGNTGLGLVHALSSAPAVRLPHGYQNGALLLHVARYNEPLLDPAHRHYVDRIDKLYQRIGFPGRFRAAELGTQDLDAMVKASTGHPFRSNNIRPTNDGDVIEILHQSGIAQEASV